ncbi:hypothetical protein CMI42_04415 [Candidatus Pacearchaeota archaeon]|nr:hypothetical protein [Candidatus Pacearchaeota archaeon]|tara:strand:+ start:1793 stop:3430 length:1638 start_codon:yes stop_codon:yes gene_type:complete
MTDKDLIYLVNAGNDPGMASMSNDYSFPALGVLALGTWLKQKMPNEIDLMVRDGAVRSLEDVIEEITTNRPLLVGVSTLCTSYQNSLKIAEAAKSYGGTVVFGNDQASQNSKSILKHQENVDYIIGAEYGEVPLELLVRHIRGEEIPLNQIPTLTYRSKSGEIKGFDYDDPVNRSFMLITNPFSGYRILREEGHVNKKDVIDLFPVVDRTLFPKDHWDTYLNNYLGKFASFHLDNSLIEQLKERHPNWCDETHSDHRMYKEKTIERAREVVSGVSTMNRIRGCSRRGESICRHCDIVGVRNGEISMSSPEMFWEEVRAAYNQVGANSLYECCDSFSSFPELIKEIVKAKPNDLGFDPRFYIYAQARDLAEHPDRVRLLKEMGVFRVNMGLESMCDSTLKNMKGEKDSVKKNYQALKLLREAGINVYGSFVLGSEKETPETLAKTVRHVRKLIKNGYLCDVEAQPVLPLSGNYQGSVLRDHGLMTVDQDNPDWPTNVGELSKVYIDRFSGVSHQDCVDAAKEIRNTARQYEINSGSGVSMEGSYQN